MAKDIPSEPLDFAWVLVKCLPIIVYPMVFRNFDSLRISKIRYLMQNRGKIFIETKWPHQFPSRKGYHPVRDWCIYLHRGNTAQNWSKARLRMPKNINRGFVKGSARPRKSIQGWTRIGGTLVEGVGNPNEDLLDLQCSMHFGREVELLPMKLQWRDCCAGSHLRMVITQS